MNRHRGHWEVETWGWLLLFQVHLIERMDLVMSVARTNNGELTSRSPLSHSSKRWNFARQRAIVISVEWQHAQCFHFHYHESSNPVCHCFSLSATHLAVYFILHRGMNIKIGAMQVSSVLSVNCCISLQNGLRWSPVTSLRLSQIRPSSGSTAVSRSFLQLHIPYVYSGSRNIWIHTSDNIGALSETIRGPRLETVDNSSAGKTTINTSCKFAQSQSVPHSRFS